MKILHQGPVVPLPSALRSSTLLTLFSYCCCFEARFSYIAHAGLGNPPAGTPLRAGIAGGATMGQLVPLRIWCCRLPRRSGFFHTDPVPTCNILRASAVGLGCSICFVPNEDFLKWTGNGFYWQNAFLQSTLMLHFPSLGTETTPSAFQMAQALVDREQTVGPQ